MKAMHQSDLPEEWATLVKAAQSARARAYAPYSQFAVGAAVRDRDGRIYTGSNVENASYGLTVCAERVAIWNAVASGQRAFSALVVASETGAMPCGACRQVLAEFAPEMPVVVVDGLGHAWMTSVNELLPSAFTPAQLSSEE